VKNILVISVLILLALQVTGQGPVMEWHEGFGTNYEEHVHGGFQTNDGGYLGVGQTWEGYSDHQDMLVVKADSTGNLEWQTVIGTENEFDVGICAIETSDGYYIGGGLYQEADDRQLRGLVKLNLDGEVIWTKTYPGTRNGAIRGIDIAFDGNLVTTGYTGCHEAGFVFIADEADGFVMKCDTSGNVIWDKSISAPQGTKIREEKDSNLAIASTKWIYSGGDYQNVLLIKVDTSGNETWTKTYGGKNHNQCFDFDLTRDGGFIFAGHTRGYGVDNWDYLLLKADASGNEEWVKTFGQPRGYDPDYIHDESYGVRQTPDGGYIIAGGSGDEYAYSKCGHPAGCSGEWKAYLVKTDSMGNRLWEGVYPTSPVGNNAAEYVGLTSDGGYIVFTDTDSESPPTPNNFGFMKLAPDTITVFNSVETKSGISGNVNLYPNPVAGGTLYLNIERNVTPDLFELIDLTGRKVKTWYPQAREYDEYSFQVGDIKDGIYLFRVIINSRSIVKQVVISNLNGNY